MPRAKRRTRKAAPAPDRNRRRRKDGNAAGEPDKAPNPSPRRAAARPRSHTPSKSGHSGSREGTKAISGVGRPSPRRSALAPGGAPTPSAARAGSLDEEKRPRGFFDIPRSQSARCARGAFVGEATRPLSARPYPTLIPRRRRRARERGVRQPCASHSRPRSFHRSPREPGRSASTTRDCGVFR